MIWMDLDGVLVNFQKGVCEALGLTYPKSSIYYRGWLEEQCPEISLGKIFERLHSQPNFWENLEPTGLCASMVAHLDEHHPDWGILTSAWRRDAQSYSGKYNWVRKHLGSDYVERLVICSGEKQKLAHSKALLVDDTSHVLTKWAESGGRAFHWLCYTEDQIGNLDAQFQRWKKHLKEFDETH